MDSFEDENEYVAVVQERLNRQVQIGQTRPITSPKQCLLRTGPAVCYVLFKFSCVTLLNARDDREFYTDTILVLQQQRTALLRDSPTTWTRFRSYGILPRHGPGASASGGSFNLSCTIAVLVHSRTRQKRTESRTRRSSRNGNCWREARESTRPGRRVICSLWKRGRRWNRRLFCTANSN